MKMWLRKSWKLVATGIDENVRLFGVNIFDYDWINTNKRVEVSGLSYEATVYKVLIKGKEYEFVAGECSNCVWNFYLYKF